MSFKITVTNQSVAPIPVVRAYRGEEPAPSSLKPGEHITGHAITINGDKGRMYLHDGLGKTILNYEHGDKLEYITHK